MSRANLDLSVLVGLVGLLQWVYFSRFGLVHLRLSPYFRLSSYLRSSSYFRSCPYLRLSSYLRMSSYSKLSDNLKGPPVPFKLAKASPELHLPTISGQMGSGWVGQGWSNSDYKAISPQLQLQLPAGTELGKNSCKV